MASAKAFREKRQARPPSTARRTAQLAFAGAHMRDLAGRPGDRAIGAERDLIDPALLVVGGEHLDARRRASVAINLPSSPPVTMRVPSPARGENAAAMNGDAARRLRRRKQQRLLAEHEHRHLPEEMHADDRRRPLRRCGRGRRARARERSGRSLSLPSFRGGHAREARVIQIIAGASMDTGSPPSRARQPNASRYAMQLSKPLRIFSSGKWRPMKTMRLVRSSPSFHLR